jgi:hypothetical protein
MPYVFVHWIHERSSEPILILSELDGSRRERRKIELFADGRFGVAAENAETGSTFLSLEIYPEIAEINSSEEFDAVPGTAEVFDLLWRTAMRSADLGPS